MLEYFEAHSTFIVVLQVDSKDLTVNEFLFCHNAQVMLDSNIFQCNNENEVAADF